MKKNKSAFSPANIDSRALDYAAMGLSGLCIFHCIALPIVAVALPVFGALAENEMVHKVLVLTALPLSVYAIIRTVLHHGDWAFAALVTLGFALLLGGAFIEALEIYEQPITAIGASLVAGGHLWRLRRHGFNKNQ